MANERRLIDIDKLRKPIYAEDDNITGCGMSPDEQDGYNDGIDTVWSMIQNAPTVNAIIPVRCKDCRYYHAETDDMGVGFVVCNKCNAGMLNPRPTDFCSYGEAKSGTQLQREDV